MSTAFVVLAGVVGALFVLWAVGTVAHAYCVLQDQRARARHSTPRRTARQPTDTRPLEADD